MCVLQQLAELKKENFGLKLRIYHLEEALRSKWGTHSEGWQLVSGGGGEALIGVIMVYASALSCVVIVDLCCCRTLSFKCSWTGQRKSSLRRMLSS